MLQQEIGIKSAKRHTRDEMNLAEFPLTLLSTRSDPKIKTLEFRDHIRGKNGEVVNREWIITGADKFGLPTASDDEILIGLLKLSVDQGFEDRKVYFTRYELLKALQWTTEGRSYSRLMKALDRLSGVRIKATNAFFDNSTKTHSTVNFGIIDAYEINDGRDISGRGIESGSSFFLWSEVLFKSFQVGYIKKLDLTFYLTLKSAISKRMFRYLDKHFWYKSKITMRAFTFAHEKLGISRNYKYLSSIRQQIDPAMDELIEEGFLASYQYDGKGEEAELTIVSRSGAPRSLGGESGSIQDQNKGINIRHEGSHNQAVTGRSAPVGGRHPNTSLVTDSENAKGEREDKVYRLTLALTERGLKERQAHKILADLTIPLLDKIAQIIEYFDDLCRSGSKLVSRSPVGFLYRAVENPINFNLPGERQGDGAAAQLSLLNSSENDPSRSGKKENKNGLIIHSERRGEGESRGDTNLVNFKAQYLVERKREAKRLRAEIEQKMLAKIRADVEVALSKFKENISEKNFNEAVEHGIEERLLALFAFPNFEEWMLKKNPA